MSYNLILLKKTKHKHDKWRILVITATFLFFLASFLLVLIDNVFGIFDSGTNCSTDAVTNELGSQLQRDFVRESPENPKLRNQEGSGCSVALNSNSSCEIRCKGISDSEVTDSNYRSCQSIQILLYLESVNFTNNTMHAGWLGEELPKTIKTLEIQKSTSLCFLEKGVFTKDLFENLTTLTLVETGILYLERDAFFGSKIDTFNFRLNSEFEVNFEKDALGYLKDTLEILQLNSFKLQPEALRNLTGSNSTKLAHLQTLDLSYNSITCIENDTFLGTPFLIQLYLYGSQIQALDVRAFSGLHDLLKVQIHDNYLVTLPEGIFDALVNIQLIQFRSNYWRCDCDLVWFKNFYEQRKVLFQDQLFQCWVNNITQVNYTEVEFCSSSLTTQSSITEVTSSSIAVSNMTTSPSEIPGTRTTKVISTSLGPEPLDYVVFVCEDCLKRSVFDPNISRIYSHTVMIRNGCITYDFYQIEGTPYYDLSLRNLIGSDYLIWINVDYHKEIGCVYNVTSVATLKNLRYGQKYVVCLLREYEETVSPFDCTALLVPPDWDQTPWIFNKDKVLLLVLCVIVVLIVIAITAVVVYFLARKNPKLNPPDKANAFLENNKVFHNEYINPPSLYSTSDGYLTPRMYERMSSERYSRRRTSRKLSTISERDSEGAFNVIYNVSKINERELYEQPPPLPPNHPKWRKFEGEDESGPSSVPAEEKVLLRSLSLQCENKCPSPVPEFPRSKSCGDEAAEQHLELFKI